MNLSNAIKSGKPFKRRDWDVWCHCSDANGHSMVQTKGSGLRIALTCEMVTAEDWEVQGLTVTITREDLAGALPADFSAEQIGSVAKGLGFPEVRA